ncbi:MAG: hypothetical protein BMS9Abin29_2264 [Gemmatimonadota bacterium]|nr:MAG: hypothetical protein BMS9Abin29_2264 [Gemmatimonadota bacterium]
MDDLFTEMKKTRGEGGAEEMPSPLAAAVSAYLMGMADQRTDLVNPVRSQAAAAIDAGNLDDVAAAIETLLTQPVPDPEAVALAHMLLTTHVEVRMVLRMGVEKDESRREALIAALATLGPSMAQTLSDALAQTEDRHARRSYVRTLVAMGQDGMTVVEEMLEDSRWFVVRNGVMVLGEVGGSTAVSFLTTTLAHADARVRRETVISLAKIGGEDAGILAIGMLGDPDADVRAGAVRAVGVLKVERALRPLLELLDEEEEDSVVEEVLRSLGQLGDPSAVPSLEKRAVGSFLRKPPTDVRVAAYTALGAIGTPHAMSLVEEALDDKEAEVRSVAAAVVAARKSIATTES